VRRETGGGALQRISIRTRPSVVGTGTQRRDSPVRVVVWACFFIATLLSVELGWLSDKGNRQMDAT
jgi:hypothetical protein